MYSARDQDLEASKKGFRFKIDSSSQSLLASWKDKYNTEHFHMLPLVEVTINELNELRNGDTPGFVLKVGKKYLYTSLENISRPRAILEGKSKHMCTLGCIHLSALPDSQGGCRKVRAFSRRIEDFPFIKIGYETFNLKDNEVFIVCECENYEFVCYK